jgi:hypothetical protein
MAVYTTTIKIINALVNEGKMTFNFTGGWIFQTGLSVAMVIIGIIL